MAEELEVAVGPHGSGLDGYIACLRKALGGHGLTWSVADFTDRRIQEIKILRQVIAEAEALFDREPRLGKFDPLRVRMRGIAEGDLVL